MILSTKSLSQIWSILHTIQLCSSNVNFAIDGSDSDKHSTTAKFVRPSTMGGRITYQEPSKSSTKSKVTQKLTFEPEKSFMEIAHSCM